MLNFKSHSGDLCLILKDQVVTVDKLLGLREKSVVQKGFLGKGLTIERKLLLE